LSYISFYVLYVKENEEPWWMESREKVAVVAGKALTIRAAKAIFATLNLLKSTGY
jgi:hypothetical protein